MVGRKKRSHSVGRVLYINIWWFQPRAQNGWIIIPEVGNTVSEGMELDCTVLLFFSLTWFVRFVSTNNQNTSNAQRKTRVWQWCLSGGTQLQLTFPCESDARLGETYICSTVLHPASLPSAKPALRTPTLAMSSSAATQQTVSFWLWSVLSCKVRSGVARRQRTKDKSRNNANCKLFCCVLDEHDTSSG